MHHKIQRKLQKIIYSLDVFRYEGNVLRIKGWMFSESSEIEDISIVMKSKSQKWRLMAETQVERIDVYNHHKKSANALNSGFYTVVLIKGVERGSIWIEYTKEGQRFKIYLGTIKGQQADKVVVKPHVETVEYLNLKNFEKKNLHEFQGLEDCDTTIDVIVPVYNGFDYLDPLFTSIQKTQMNYRLILIEDCSPDKRVKEYLRAYRNEHPETVLIENEENLGFVKSVNKGLIYSTSHVALVNTDVEVPNMWLERLMAPILENESVASTTPYTNAGTICSFPKLGDDNELFLDLDLETIDNEFKKIKPRYVEMPTGVGFCMGMSRRALDIVGLLDEESFGKGYCEENDWCQRAVENNMLNVHVENLYVYHKHGGSFLSEDKKKYIEENSKILQKKHPYYFQEVAYFFEVDPNRDIRKYVEWKLLSKVHKETTLVFNHNLGGGATSYLDAREQEILNQGDAYCLIRCNYDIGRTEVIYKYQDCCVKFGLNNLNGVSDMLSQVKPDRIIINEFVSYPQLYDVLELVGNYKRNNKTELTFLFHDFYAVCPTVNLLDDAEKFCGIPNIERCEQCVKNNCELKYLDFNSMKEWREEWKKFLQLCDHVVTFSNDSKEVVEKAFGELGNLRVTPHKIDYLPVIDKQYKHTKTLNIGLLGNLVKHKGAEAVKETLKYIEKNNLNINIVLIGKSGENIQSKHFVETGAYSRDMIPRLIYENDIDVFWIASIWPETFSYTTEEIMTMKFPIMSFDLGAPAERIKKYEKGAVIPNMNPEAVISVAQGLYEKNQKPYKDKKILFIVEEVTFSSRYRVEHLREQLIYRGIVSDCFTIQEALKENLNKYESIVIYRSSQVKPVQKLVGKAHKLSKQVYYDIDDFIFEYEAISDLDFLKYDEYKNFKTYCDNIKKTMLQCDGYITSTNALAEQISNSMKSNKVYINRNVASAEMAVISLAEKCHVKKDSEKIVLGYFSGTKTHDKDFELIKDALLKLMEKYSNLYLRVGGQINLAKEFTPFIKRVETFGFVSWKELPRLIAGVDINLMPLEDSIFHVCKSENKWQEAALVGVPTIASYNSELAGAFTDEKEGFLCKTSEEWEEKLEKLIVDKELRKAIVTSAYDKVMREYTTYTREISNIVNILCGEDK